MKTKPTSTKTKAKAKAKPQIKSQAQIKSKPCPHQALFEGVYKTSVGLLASEGELAPVAFFRSGAKASLVPPGVMVPVLLEIPGGGFAKDGLAHVLRDVVRKVDAELTLMVLESWMVRPTKSESQQILKGGGLNVRPSERPDRVEVVLYSLNTPTGCWGATVEITRDAAGKPSIPATPPILAEATAGGRFGNLFEAPTLLHEDAVKN